MVLVEYIKIGDLFTKANALFLIRSTSFFCCKLKPDLIKMRDMYANSQMQLQFTQNKSEARETVFLAQRLG